MALKLSIDSEQLKSTTQKSLNEAIKTIDKAIKQEKEAFHPDNSYIKKLMTAKTTTQQTLQTHEQIWKSIPNSQKQSDKININNLPTSKDMTSVRQLIEYVETNNVNEAKKATEGANNIQDIEVEKMNVFRQMATGQGALPLSNILLGVGAASLIAGNLIPGKIATALNLSANTKFPLLDLLWKSTTKFFGSSAFSSLTSFIAANPVSCIVIASAIALKVLPPFKRFILNKFNAGRNLNKIAMNYGDDSIAMSTNNNSYSQNPAGSSSFSSGNSNGLNNNPSAPGSSSGSSSSSSSSGSNGSGNNPTGTNETPEGNKKQTLVDQAYFKVPEITGNPEDLKYVDELEEQISNLLNIAKDEHKNFFAEKNTKEQKLESYDKLSESATESKQLLDNMTTFGDKYFSKVDMRVAHPKIGEMFNNTKEFIESAEQNTREIAKLHADANKFVKFLKDPKEIDKLYDKVSDACDYEKLKSAVDKMNDRFNKGKSAEEIKKGIDPELVELFLDHKAIIGKYCNFINATIEEIKSKNPELAKEYETALGENVSNLEAQCEEINNNEKYKGLKDKLIENKAKEDIKEAGKKAVAAIKEKFNSIQREENRLGEDNFYLNKKASAWKSSKATISDKERLLGEFNNNLHAVIGEQKVYDFKDIFEELAKTDPKTAEILENKYSGKIEKEVEIYNKKYTEIRKTYEDLYYKFVEDLIKLKANGTPVVEPHEEETPAEAETEEGAEETPEEEESHAEDKPTIDDSSFIIKKEDLEKLTEEDKAQLKAFFEVYKNFENQVKNQGLNGKNLSNKFDELSKMASGETSLFKAAQHDGVEKLNGDTAKKIATRLTEIFKQLRPENKSSLNRNPNKNIRNDLNSERDMILNLGEKNNG